MKPTNARTASRVTALYSETGCGKVSFNFRILRLSVGRAERLKRRLELGLARRIQRGSRSHQAEEQRQRSAAFALNLPQVHHDGIQQFAGKRHVLMLHHDQSVEDGVAKEHAGHCQDRNDDLPEARHFAGALYYAGSHDVSDENRSVEKYVVY